MKYMLVKFLGSLSFGFLGGVLVHSLFLDIFFSHKIIIISLVICCIFLFFFKNIQHLLIIVFCLGIIFGILRFSVSIQNPGFHIFDIFAQNNTTITVHGSIISDPIQTLSYTEFTVETDSLVMIDNNILPAATRMLIKTDTYTDYEYGQKVLVNAVVQKPTAFETDTGRIFNYQTYLAKDGVYYVMPYAETKILDQGNQTIQRKLFALKHRFLEKIYRHIPEPESGLLAGVLFGEKSALGDELEDDFRAVGLMHIVVLSGYNISLVIQIFTKLLRFLPRGLRSLLAVLGITAFALLVGAGPTVIRASIMAVFIVLADIVSARYNITRALFIAGLVMIIWNPMILYFDISFQLSFLATYGLIVFSPFLEKKLSFIPRWFAMRESAVATISAQIIVLPLLLYSIGEFSLVSPLVNILVLFAVPFSMLFGFLTASFALLNIFGISFLAGITTLLLKYQLIIVQFFAHTPFAVVTVPAFHWLGLILMYCILFLWIRKLQNSFVVKI